MSEGEQKPVTLNDVINYKPEEYLSSAEVDLIQRTFKGNKELLKVLRKVFIPTISDPDLPIEQFANDMFMDGRSWSQIGVNEAKALIVARQDALQFIIGGFIKLNVIAHQTPISPEDQKKAEEKNSTK